MAKKIDIFKPGTHTAMNGRTIEFTEADLAAAVAAYDPAKYEAPLVVGHPKIDAPAYGWVRGLDFADGVLRAEPHQVDVQFAEVVNAGRFKRISASFFLPEAPNNPAPGSYYLRHVGFLGAAAPAVQGLKAANFAAGEEGVVEFGDWNDRMIARLFRNLKNLLIAKFGAEEAESALPEWDLETVVEEAVRPEPAVESSPMYAAPEGGKETADMLTPEQIAEREANFAAREAAIAAREAAGRRQEHLSFADALVKEGKLLPAQKERVVAILDFAAGLDQQTVIEFGEGEEKTTAPVGQSLREFLSAQPKIVEFGETAGDDEEGNHTAVAFTAAPGYTVDAAALEIHIKAIAYQGKHPGTDYMTAVKAVS
ncbi:peptidase [Pseudomonas sp.]|uniref:peptidase n=1 Tax=Pseudomonas sp. TaxID=306 RepID=UPI003D09DAF5